MSDWYLKDPAGTPTGPHPTQAMLQWISAGQVTATQSVCAVGATKWVAVNEVPIFVNALTARGGGGGATGQQAACS